MNREAMPGAAAPADARRPQPCREHHRRQTKDCIPCRRYITWYSRERRQGLAAGTWEGMRDTAVVAAHVKNLQRVGVSLKQIAKLAGVAEDTLWRIAQCFHPKIRTATADAVLGVVPPPLRERSRRIPSAGTHRRVRLLALQGWWAEDLATAIGDIAATTFYRLLERPTAVVSCYVAAEVAAFYDAHRGKTGPNPSARERALKRGYLPAWMWPGDTIDDPAYDPLAQVPVTFGVRRRLRALARHGHGHHALSRPLHSPADDILAWTRNAETCPAYIAGILADLFERLGPNGPDHEARRDAEQLNWATPAAWYGRNIDDPAARPTVDGPKLSPDEVDDYRVNGALEGYIKAKELTTAERVIVIDTLIRRGWNAMQIGLHMRWSENPQNAHNSVLAFKRRHCADPTEASSLNLVAA